MEERKMLNGEFYDSMSSELLNKRIQCKELIYKLNNIEPAKLEEKEAIYKRLFKDVQKLYIEPPFYCDYGSNITIGDNTYFNFNCTILDCAKVEIGANCLFGPNVSIYAATHPISPKLRLEGKEFSKPITIGNNVWICGGVTICPGVTIGDNSIVGAGSVVTKDVPANVVVAGNPIMFVKDVEEKL